MGEGKDSAQRFQQLLLLNRESKLPQYPTDTFYRSMVPTTLRENAEYRRRLLDLCYEHEKYREQVWIMCARDILFYVNTFLYTLDSKDHPKNPVRPFITWPSFQNQAILDLQAAIGNYDVNIPKSRQMGASWMCMTVFEHFWHFLPQQSFLVVSAKEDLVDKTNDPKALFPKLDFIHDRLPKFLLPTGRELGRDDPNRIRKHLRNKDNGSVVEGEATIKDLGRGGTYTAILIDEAGTVENGADIEAATRDATNCRIRNSTPKGRFGTGAPFFNAVRKEGAHNVWIHWSDHPAKREGLYTIQGGHRVPLGEEYDWKKHYSFSQLKFTGTKPRSVWYDAQCQRASSSIEVAQECDLDFHGSAETLIDAETVERVLRYDVALPTFEGELEFDGEDVRWTDIDGGKFRLWCPFDGESPPLSEYSVGADIGAGTGGEYTSNSALFIFDSITAEQVGEFAINTMDPVRFCHYAVAVCKWFGNAFLIPERNGSAGETFINELRTIGYRNVYRPNKENVPWEEKTDKLGYHSSKTSNLIFPLVNALKFKKIRIRSEVVINELLEYEFVASGDVKHAGSRVSLSNADKGTTHGDIAIAACCAYLGVKEAVQQDLKAPPIETPADTPAWRHEERMRRERSGVDEFVFG